jgi:hypothetical protein
MSNGQRSRANPMNKWKSYGAMMALHVPYMFFPALIVVCLGRGIVLYMNEHGLLQRLFGERQRLALSDRFASSPTPSMQSDASGTPASYASITMTAVRE